MHIKIGNLNLKLCGAEMSELETDPNDEAWDDWDYAHHAAEGQLEIEALNAKTETN